MSTTGEVLLPNTWGVTVDDVKNRLPHISFEAVADSGNIHYEQNTTKTLSDTEIQQFIIDAASHVSARLYRYDRVPERTQANLNYMARAVVADGAAHFAHTALFPGSSSPNDGDAYSQRLWERFSTQLDTLGGLVDSIAAEEGSRGPGGVYSSFPLPMFPDYEAY